MKDLKEYIKEEIFATPANTMGMGNISFPTETQPGSGDIPNAGWDNKKRKKKFKRYKI